MDSSPQKGLAEDPKYEALRDSQKGRFGQKNVH
jgi:hypothetical protein